MDNTADPDSVDDDWLTYFFEHAKNIGKEEMAVIWSHILAREMNTPNHIPKSLIYILSVIDYEDVVVFRKLANVSIQVGEGYYPIYFMDMPDIYKEIELEPNDIIRLQETNLIQYSKHTYNILLNPEDNITYFDKEIDIGCVGKICVGEVILSKAGHALMSVITDKRKVDGFEEFVKKTVIKTDYKIAKVLSN